MSKLFNDNDYTDTIAMLKKQKDADSKKYENDVKKLLEDKYGYEFVAREAEIKEYDLESKTGEKIEVKSDYTILKSNKLFIEVWDNLTNKEIGWIRYCEADTLAVVGIDASKNLPVKIVFYDFKQLQDYVLKTYFNGDWSNTNSCYDEYGDRFIFALKDRPYLKYMLVDINMLEKYKKFEYIYAK